MRRSLLAAGMLLAACVDPRARPVPPQLVLQFPAGLEVHSPGTLPHTLYVYDADGIDQVELRVLSADSTMHIDSTVVPVDLFQANLSFTWSVPANIPIGTTIRVVARVTDFVGFITADSASFLVQDTTSLH